MSKTITLANGVEMPRVGMGVFQMTPEQLKMQQNGPYKPDIARLILHKAITTRKLSGAV